MLTLALVVVVLSTLCSTGSQAYTWADWTPLDEYVQSDDGFFEWTELAQYDYDGVTVYILNMTSQQYQDEIFLSRSIWWHWAAVAVPNNIRFPFAGFLYIGGQDNDETFEFPPQDHFINTVMARLANDTGTCGGYIFQVPNQPTVFYNDPDLKSRREDSIIAWSWRTYLDDPTPDPTVILRMPMTKAGKRGLDMIHEVAKAKAPATHIDRFVVFGASKRGWTTWSLACTDRRVIALVPLVFSLINMNATIMNHFQNMDGAWSFALGPYYNENLTNEFYNPKTDEIYDVEDIYRYKDRLAGIPKLLISATGDEFFLLDDTYQWWGGMPDPKWFSILPNAEHTLAPHYIKIYETICSFWQTLLEELPMPDVKWTMQETTQGGLIVVDTIPMPDNITAWSAVTLGNDTRRDFRLAQLDQDTGDVVSHPVPWAEDVNVVDFLNGYQYGASVYKIDGEWIGYFIQMIYTGPAPTYYRMYLSTQVNVVPNARPRGPCLSNDECYSILV